ncbi:MAG: peptidase S11 [Betaproteobacteria bacterium]|nr:peptidase S11 [Betaproteobacteria bacterium]
MALVLGVPGGHARAADPSTAFDAKQKGKSTHKKNAKRAAKKGSKGASPATGPLSPSMSRAPAMVSGRIQKDPSNRMGASTRLGLQSVLTEAALSSSAVLVVDQISNEVLFEKNSDAVLPIASITKLMTAVVVSEAGQPMDELLTVSQEDADLEKNARSRLVVGTQLTRGQFLHLALMSSENRAAHLLGRHYPGGLGAFVRAMNAKAIQLGMTASRFVEPTGLNSANVSSPRDLARLVEEAHSLPQIREYSTARNMLVRVRGRQQHFINTNALARGSEWELGLSKTGFIREAGRCLVMQASIEDRPVIMVMLDASGKQQRLQDAERIRRWLIQQADRKTPITGPQAREVSALSAAS